MSTTARQLTLSTTHTDITIDTIEHHGITAADLPHIATYLANLIETLQYLASRASEIFETAALDHLLRTSPHAANALAHLTNSLKATLEFAYQTEHELDPTASDHPANAA